MSSVPRGRAVLFNIFINDLQCGIELTFSKVANGTKMSGAVNTEKRRDAIQRDLDWFEKWAHDNLVRFNKVETKMLHLG